MVATGTFCPLQNYLLLNYLLLIAKIHIWDCRSNCVRPYIEGFQFKIKIKYEIDREIYCYQNPLLLLPRDII